MYKRFLILSLLILAFIFVNSAIVSAQPTPVDVRINFQPTAAPVPCRILGG